jgi:hypothetical protein
MNSKLNTLSPTQSKAVAVLLISLTLWLNLAFIEHSLEIEEHQHSEHQCQLFSAVTTGLICALPTIPMFPQQPIVEPYTDVTWLFTALPTKKARSPPTSSITS